MGADVCVLLGKNHTMEAVSMSSVESIVAADETPVSSPSQVDVQAAAPN